MSKIDGSKINQYIEGSKKKKPPYITVSDDQWCEALDGYTESFYEAVDKQTTTEEFWQLVYFSALAFCKGMQRQQEIDGKISESNYPRY